MMSVEMESMREEMKDDFAGKLSEINDKVSEHLQRVMEQVRTIQESAQATNELLKDRIADAFLDIQRYSIVCPDIQTCNCLGMTPRKGAISEQMTVLQNLC